VYNLSFQSYAGSFHHFKYQKVPHWPKGDPSLITKLIQNEKVRGTLEALLQKRNILRVLDKCNLLYDADDLCELSEDDIQKPIFKKSNKLLIWTAWNLHFETSRQLHRKTLIEIFRPTQDISNVIDDKLSHINEDTFLIGVHIRRGDYKEYLGGAYYFSYPEYRSLLERLYDLVGVSNVHFIIVSNEPVPISVLEGLPATWLVGSEVEDLYSLARCNLIVGPPSTYSDWAMFYGNSKRYVFTGTLPVEHDL
jgi:hypothetical protein